MAELRTDYKDQLLDLTVNQKRKYRVTNNEDGTISLDDVSIYSQIGDEFSAEILNEIIKKLGNGNVRYNEETDWVQILDADGIWQDWEKGGLLSDAYLYKNGDECVDITGGWEASTAFYANGNIGTLPPTKNTDNIYLYSGATKPGGSSISSATVTANRIDLSGYTKLWVEYKSGTVDASTSMKPVISIVSSKTAIIEESSVAGKTNLYSLEKAIDYLDITDVNGSYYIVLSTVNGRDAYIYNVWLK